MNREAAPQVITEVAQAACADGREDLVASETFTGARGSSSPASFVQRQLPLEVIQKILQKNDSVVRLGRLALSPPA